MNRGPVEERDSDFLDEVFDEAVALLHAGREPDPLALCAGRDGILEQVEELIELAREVAGREVGARPCIPGYELLRKLGAGGAGSVWLARQLRLGGRLVALKIVRAPAELDGRARSRFLSEARLLARIDHPHVVAIHDVVEHGELCAYAMEWARGGSLERVVAQRAHASRASSVRAGAELGSLVRIGRAVAGALGAVHAAGLVHRDVKPSNVLLREDGHPLLSDFGLARALDASFLTRTGEFLGTPAYASPEQLRGGREPPGPRSDVYSLGVSLFHLVAGRHPYYGESRADLLAGIESGRTRPLRSLVAGAPRDLETVLAKAMDPSPARRYASEAELADDLGRLLDLEPIRARRVPPWRRAAMALRRNRATLLGAVLGGGVALALAALAVAYAFWFPRLADERLRLGRSALLDPVHWEATFLARHDPASLTASWASDRRVRGEAVLESYRRAVELYRGAARLRPFDRALRGELAVVEAALAYLERGEVPGSGGGADAPLRVYLAWWTAPARERDVEALLAGRPPTELRELALLAFLCGDAQTANAAWLRVAPSIGDDAFVDAALGLVDLGDGELARALARLEVAFSEFPRAGFLAVAIADAALQLGLEDEARIRIAQARELPRHDPYDTLRLIEADWLAWNGSLEEARRAYAEVAMVHMSARARVHLIELLLLSGEHDAALVFARELCGRRLDGTSYLGLYADLARSRWDRLSRPERQAAVRDGLVDAGPPNTLREQLGLLAAARDAPREAGGWRVPARFRERWKSWNPAPEPLSPVRGGVALDDLVFTEALLQLPETVRMKLPVPLRSFLASLSLSADARLGASLGRAGIEVRRAAARRLEPLTRVLGALLAPVAAVSFALSGPGHGQLLQLDFEAPGVSPVSDPLVGFDTNGPTESAAYTVQDGNLEQRTLNATGSAYYCLLSAE